MDKKPAPKAEPVAPVVAMDPPHGGSWMRKADGTLELIDTTKPATGRRGTTSPVNSPASLSNETPEE